MIINLRERGREGERGGEKHGCERNINQLLLVHPYRNPLSTQHVSRPGIKPVTFQFTGPCSNQLSHTG